MLVYLRHIILYVCMYDTTGVPRWAVCVLLLASTRAKCVCVVRVLLDYILHTYTQKAVNNVDRALPG